MKKCSKCKTTRLFTEFSNCSKSKDGKKTQCKICVSEVYKKYYDKNKDSLTKQRREYYYENQESETQKKKEYRKRKRSELTAKERLRKAKKLQATPSWLTEEQLLCIQRMYILAREMKDISGIEYHIDHILPLKSDVICGLHVPWNLQILEATQNIVKGNKLLDQDQEFYHQIQEFDDLMENICEKY